MTTGWLKCRVSKGMFSDEVAVTYPVAGGTFGASSFFVPKEDVQGAAEEGCAVDGKVSVRFFKEGATVWAILPAESQPVIKVSEQDLVPNK
jgi:hypothetical protein